MTDYSFGNGNSLYGCYLIEENKPMSIINTQGTYWNHTGKYQELSDRLQELVPAVGRCNTSELELFRLVNNIYYDLYNNGLCNAENKLEALQPVMRWYKQDLLTNGMTEEQYRLVWDCWKKYEWTSLHSFDDDDETENEGHPNGYFPEWDESIDWFSEKLELAFEALADAATLIAAKANGWV
jgi:hypothetical protein